MRKTRPVCLALLTALLALPAAAEDPVITRVVIWKAKPGMETKLEEGLKKHNEFHRRINDAMSYTTCAVSSGPETGTYLRFASNRTWKDFDAEEANAKADQADSAVTTDPYLASTTVSYYRYWPDLSRPRQAEAAMYSVTFYRVKFSKVSQFMRGVRRAREAAEKAQWAGRWAMFSLVNGGDGPTFVLSSPRDKWADFNPIDPTFDKMLESTLGREEADAVAALFDESVEGTSTEILTCRPDLGYTPAKK